MSLVFAFSLVPSLSNAQKPKERKAPTVVSVADLLSNYGLDTAMVNDTVQAELYLANQPQDYVTLTNLCVSIRTKAQAAISSLENDYQHLDSLIWLDSNTVVSDYTIYEFRLRRLADWMGRMSIRYSRLEQQRIEAEKEAARLRAEEEARRAQEARDKEASDLKGSIELHHRAIITACDGAGIADKNRQKELKDLYYSYLMVYNKYDLSSTHATDQSIQQLDELNSFQNDLLENVLGNNSLPYQIENFKNQLKLRCEKGNSDVYRSYSRVFKQTSVPVTFADVKEYEEYVNRLRTIINVQNRYLQTLDLRAQILSGTDAIVQLYGKKYRDVVNSYKEVVRSLNQLPSFTTNAESINFITELEDFIAAQQIYLDDYIQLEDINSRSDSIVNGKDSRFRDVVNAYRDIRNTLVPLPTFKNAEGAAQYESELEEVRHVQTAYLQVIKLRERIQENDDSISANRKLDRTVFNGYKLFRQQADLTPNFSTVERGNSFLSVLNSHIEMQTLCLLILHKRRLIEANSNRIETKCGSVYRNIQKAYSRMLKVYDDSDDITNSEDLRRYARQCDYILEMQEAFLTLLSSDVVQDSDKQLRRESDIDKIKVVIGLK